MVTWAANWIREAKHVGGRRPRLGDRRRSGRRNQSSGTTPGGVRIPGDGRDWGGGGGGGKGGGDSSRSSKGRFLHVTVAEGFLMFYMGFCNEHLGV